MRMRLSVLIILSLFLVTCLSEECAWNGKLTGQWENSDNWSCGKVPRGGDHVFFLEISSVITMLFPVTVQSVTVGPNSNVQLSNALSVADRYDPIIPSPTLFTNKGIFQVAGNLEVTLKTNQDDSIASNLMFQNDGELYVQGSLVVSVQPSNSFTFNFFNLVENLGLMCIDEKLSISVNTQNSFINSNQIYNSGTISAASVHVYLKASQLTQTSQFKQFSSNVLITKYVNITLDANEANLISNDGKAPSNQIIQFESTDEFTSCGKATPNKINFNANPSRLSNAKQFKLKGAFRTSLRDKKTAFKLFPGFGETQPLRTRVKCQAYKCIAPGIAQKNEDEILSQRSLTGPAKRLVGLVVVE